MATATSLVFERIAGRFKLEHEEEISCSGARAVAALQASHALSLDPKPPEALTTKAHAQTLRARTWRSKDSNDCGEQSDRMWQVPSQRSWPS